MARVHPDHHPPVALLTLRLTWEVAEGSGREAVAQEKTPQQLSMTVNDRVTGAKYVLETSWTLIYCQGGQRRTVEEASILLHPSSGLSSPSVGAGQGGQRARGPGRALLLNARTTLGLNRQGPQSHL